MMRRPFAFLSAAVLTATLALGTSTAMAAKSSCPSSGTPAPGSTVEGGLRVDGLCDLDDVTVVGGVAVGAGGYLRLWDGGRVSGGITVNQGGALAVNADFFTGLPTGTSATVDGGIKLNRALNFDISTARISGGVTVTEFAGAGFIQPTFCGNEVSGGMSMADALTGVFWIGTDSPIFGSAGACPGNTLNGSFSAVNSGAVNLENNRVTGTVRFDSSFVIMGATRSAAACSAAWSSVRSCLPPTRSAARTAAISRRARAAPKGLRAPARPSRCAGGRTARRRRRRRGPR